MTYFWFRRDLRLDDNRGLFEALKNERHVQCLFIFDRGILDELEDKDDRRLSFIHLYLRKLKAELKELGSDLRVEYGFPLEVFQKLGKEKSIEAIYTNRDYEPSAIVRDKEVREWLESQSGHFLDFKDQVIFEPGEVLKDDGQPYAVYTPFMKRWKANFRDQLLKIHQIQDLRENLAPDRDFDLPSLESMGFEFNETHFPSPEFPRAIIRDYHKTRDIPAIQGTSRMSVHLRFGTISIRRLFALAFQSNEKYLNELIWREFYFSILGHFPHVVNGSFRPIYDQLEWENREDWFEAWCEGRTGFPIVDAGMRELNATGHMHNRVRMITASFLTKDLLVDWRWGEAYFARKLLDFELSNNNGGWQWASGSGCDAAPYFRVFNPDSQQKKFDPELKYIRKWIPEYGTPAYPEPIVDHAKARIRALEFYKKVLARE
jgi:deoxyribodipyrimidine photo-lyase